MCLDTVYNVRVGCCLGRGGVVAVVVVVVVAIVQGLWILGRVPQVVSQS